MMSSWCNLQAVQEHVEYSVELWIKLSNILRSERVRQNLTNNKRMESVALLPLRNGSWKREPETRTNHLERAFFLTTRSCDGFALVLLLPRLPSLPLGGKRYRSATAAVRSVLHVLQRSLFSPHPVYDPVPNNHADEPQTIGRALLHTVTVQQLKEYEDWRHDSWRRERWRCCAWRARAGDAIPGDPIAGGGSAGDVPAGVCLETRQLEIGCLETGEPCSSTPAGPTGQSWRGVGRDIFIEDYLEAEMLASKAERQHEEFTLSYSVRDKGVRLRRNPL
ncbi:hypothetical protein IW261DRAFT_1598155 [Armillaria novae-zelandiae]|uniref:Uncharacterized protein n=1 Tax=Armillaria novae-zelandiae TaxID=153914 RepID=A0AA39TVF1_9AGAR|nr:hypothetical protein IW261DRAFT_1598155 [Armillaria novae-zelandiae]